MRQKTVAIVHYNTPELTACAIMSLWKHGGGDYRVVVFDNSDERPFRDPLPNVEVVDNTKGQLIDFDKELAAYPERDRSIGCAKGCEFGSVKHMMSVQKLWELIPDGFVLMDSDILIKKNIDEFFDDHYSVYGYCQKAQPHNPFFIGRMLPMLCWMNVPMLTREGARYFDPTRTYGLLPGGSQNRNNWYDTGAVLLEDILQKRPRLKGYHRDIREFVEHYGSGSWRNNDLKKQTDWLDAHRRLWEPERNGKVAVCAMGRLEGRYAVEWVDHYKAIGVDHIFILDDNRPDDEEDFEDILVDYIESGYVSLLAATRPMLQKEAYENLYALAEMNYEWIGFLDFDELVLTEGKDIHDLLRHYDADAVVMSWRTMTDNGLTHYDGRAMAVRFTEGTDERFEINRHVKCFVRSGIVGISFNDPHCPNAPKMNVVNVMNEQVEQRPIQPKAIHKVAWINHYNTKTAEEWVTLKMRRLSPCGEEYNKEMKAKNVEYFFSINKRTPEKEAILGVSKPRQTKSKKNKK